MAKATTNQPRTRAGTDRLAELRRQIAQTIVLVGNTLESARRGLDGSDPGKALVELTLAQQFVETGLRVALEGSQREGERLVAREVVKRVADSAEWVSEECAHRQRRLRRDLAFGARKAGA